MQRDMPEVRPLILIPSYNTGPILRQTVMSVLACQTPTWVVINGSTDASPKSLESIDHEHFRIIQMEKNSGKGAAILHGLREAIASGFTHILSIDADGQHPAGSIPEFLKLSAAHPEAAI